MPIYITCHPIDDVFAIEMSAYLMRISIESEHVATIDDVEFSNGDIVIVILRSEYLHSPAYIELEAKLANCIVLPILRSPIDISDWINSNVLNPLIDFTNYRQEQIASGLNQLAGILNSYNLEIRNCVNPYKPYLHKLEAGTLRNVLPAYLLETVNYYNSSLQQHPVFRLLSAMLFDVFSISETASSSVYRTDSLGNITRSAESCLIHCQNIDTSLIASHLIDIASIGSEEKSISLLLDSRTWSKELSSTQWLYDQIGTNQTELANFGNVSVTIYVYGFEQPVTNSSEFQRDFRKWWNETSPSLSLIILSPSPSTSSSEQAKWSWSQLQQLSAFYPSRAFAKYINSLTEDDNLHHKFMVQNPVFTAMLLSVRYADGTDFSRLCLKDYFEYLINNLRNLSSFNKRVDYTDVEGEISKIAAIMTENCRTFVAYEDALSYTGSDPLLLWCIDTGIFTLELGNLRFSLSIFQHYFASIALLKYGIPSHLPTLTLNTHSARIPQKWDQPLILVNYFKDSGELEVLIRRIADNDPLLALECLSNHRSQNPSLYKYVIEKNLELLVSIGDFRTDFAKRLYHYDSAMSRSVLLEALRNGKCEVRQYAYQVINALEFPIKTGLVEALTALTNDKRTDIALILKRMAEDALPTLFSLLQSDDNITRCNAMWALGEIADKASVPSLVSLLSDKNVNVAILAASTLARTQDVYALPYLIKQLDHRHINMRNAVTNTILALYDQQRDAFIKLLQQIDVTTRRQMVIYLSSTKFNKLKIDLFLELTRDEDVDIRIAAIKALAPIKNDHVTARFKECLDDMSKSRLNKSSVGEIVSRILSNVPHGEHGIKPRDASHVMNSSQIVKARLLNVKGQQSTAEVIPQNESHTENEVNLEDGYVADILTQLRSRKWDTSNNAAKMLRDYMKSLRGNASSKVVNQVLETLNDDDWVIRWTGVESLGWVGNVHVVPHLIQRLFDPNWKVRVAAIRALAEIKDNSAIAGLSKLNTDTNTVVREAAAEALGFLDGKQAVVALEVFAIDSEDFVRLASVESLGRIMDKVAMAALLSALNDTSDHVRWAAANGLMGIADATTVPKLISSLSDIGGPYWEQKRICDVIIDILKKINTEEAKKAVVDWQTKQA